MTQTHLWVRAEQRDNETRVGITPKGAAALIEQGFKVTVEASDTRVIPTDAYAQAGCTIAPQFSWPQAPSDVIIFGLKELPADGSPLPHRHIMFGHAYKGQSSGRILLERFKAGGGTLYDLEYLTTDAGRRVAAFGYWAGFAGAAVAVTCWAAQMRGETAAPITPSKNADALTNKLQEELATLDTDQLDALVIGALGRVGTGAADLCKRLGIPVTAWDMAETASGGPFPEILDHTLFFNCILAGPTTPVFVPKTAINAPRKLRVIGDIACDPDSAFNPVPIYTEATTWGKPALRVHDAPPLEVTAIDNLPSMLPLESSEDYASQLLPTLQALLQNSMVWQRAEAIFGKHLSEI
ncbi:MULTISPECIES: saccharopine dehydrogenase [unclassified Sulfitobacter]|uniref:saccharopine dehydrogenase n=1 Tax=unclassified Sulfitobacter TaxID=196795 RepID=UPI0015934EB7|nr:saccharopine dehydrogenase [Sulfitobacter sp. HGT1]